MTADRGPLYRLGALAGLVALAGCSDGDSSESPTPTEPESATPAPDRREPDARPTATTEREATVDRGTPSPAVTPTATERPTPSPTPDAACRDRIASIEGEIDETDAEIEAVRAAREPLRTRADWLRKPVEFLDRSYADETLATAESVGRMVRESTVLLRPGGGVATGWFVDEGLVVTNAHNVAYPGEETTETVVGYTVDGDEFQLELIEAVDTHSPDVALMRTDYAGTPLETGSVDSVAAGDPLVQVGHPGSVGAWVVAIGRLRTTETFVPAAGEYRELQTTVPGMQGNSGSPIVDLEGTVVGMTYAGIPLLNDDFAIYPQPDPLAVYDNPLMKMEVGAHVGVDIVVDLVEEWT